MSIRKEFEKLVKEANQKLEVQNQRKASAEAKTIQELHKRQQMLINILSSNNVQDTLQTGFND